MQQNKHSASGAAKGITQPEVPEARLVAMVPPRLKWAFKAIAARKQTTAKDLIVVILEEYVAREGAVA